MRRYLFYLILTIVLLAANRVVAANIKDGYENLKWGTHFHKVTEAYPKGQIGEFNKDIIYTQDNPEETIATRIFAFRGGKLASVAVTFSSDYVKKVGLENLKQKYVKQYGKGQLTGNSSHMVTYGWEGKKTRVTFIYVPNRTDMTVIQYECK